MSFRLYSFICLSLFLTFASSADQEKSTTGPGELLAHGFVLPVNGDAVSTYDLIEKIQPQLQTIGTDDYKEFYTKAYPLVREKLMSEIYDLLMYQYSMESMEKNGLDDEVIESERQKHKKDIVRQYGGNEPMANIELEKKGTTMDKELDKFVRRMVISSYRDVFFSGDQTVSRVEMMEYYNNHLEEYTIAASLKFSLIEISSSKQQAEDALSKLENGEDFAELAKKVSTGWRSSYGGAWNEVAPDSVKKIYQPVVDSLVKLQPGQLTDVIESEGKYFIGKLDSYTAAEVKPLSKVQDEIKKSIYNLRWIDYTSRLSEKLMNRAVVGDIDSFIAGTIYTAWKKFGGEE